MIEFRADARGERASMTGEGGEPANTDGLQYPMVDLFTGGMILPMVLMNAVRRRATCYGLLHRCRSWTCGRKRLRPRGPYLARSLALRWPMRGVVFDEDQLSGRRLTVASICLGSVLRCFPSAPSFDPAGSHLRPGRPAERVASSAGLCPMTRCAASLRFS